VKAADAASRRTARGTATRARILDSAAELVQVGGVTATTLDAVLAASGTSKSQLYHSFRDKDDLILAVVRRQTERVLASQEPYLHDLDSIGGLRRWGEALVELQRRHACAGGCPIGSLVAQLAESPRPRAVLAESFHEWESYLVVGFRAMRDRGELTPGTDPEELATTVMAAVQGGLLLTQATRTTRPLELALRMAFDHVAARVDPQPPGVPPV